MKLCYVLLVHHKFDQAERLVRRLAREDVNFVIHIDRKVEPLVAERFRSALASVPSVSYAERVDAQWGTYRQALAIMRGVQGAVQSGIAFDRCVLLSGQDYPIASHADIAAFFAAHPHQEFIEAYELDMLDSGTRVWTPYYRFRRYHVWLGKRRWTLPWLRKRVPHVTMYHGATWWALSRGAVEQVARRFEEDAALRRFLRTGFLVDEAYVPTLLMNSTFAPRVTGANVTFAQWTPTSGAHPKTLTLDDVDALIASPKLFARKFDSAADSAVLDRLDTIVG